MAQIPFKALPGPSYTMFSPKAEIQRSICLYRERVESDEGLNPFVMNKSPGLTISGGVPVPVKAGTVRGMLELNDYAFAVIADTLVNFDAGGVITNYGLVADDGTPIQMAASDNSLMLVSAGVLYRVNANVLSAIALPFVPIGIVLIKNYFVVLSNSLKQFYWSTDDGATFDPLNVQTAEADANNMLAIQAVNQLLCIVGNRITQWFSVGTNALKPFVPIDSGVMRSGTAAAASVTKLGSSLFWLEQTKEGRNAVIMTNGFTPVKVSSNAVANKIRALDKISSVGDAIGMAYTMNNQEFYRLTFPGADYTLEYNKTLNEWEDPLWLDWADGDNGTYHRHRGNCMVSAFGKILVGDHTNGYIYEMSPDVYHDYGFPMRFERRTPHVIEGNKKIAIDRLDLLMQTGVGLTTPLWLNNYLLDAATFAANLATAVSGATVTAAQAVIMQAIYNFVPYDTSATLPDEPVMTPLGFYEWGRNPQITLKYSGDGGKSYSSELNRSIGRAGENPDVFWNRLGTVEDFVIELFGDDPCQISIASAWLDAEELLG